MQSALSTAPARAKRVYANDGSLQSVEAMLMKMAATFYPRVMALGLPMDFEDVKQELHMAYVKALAKWSPEKARFTTYCYTVARNEFNRRIERMVLDRQHLGLGSIDDHNSCKSEDDPGDGFDRYVSADAECSSPEDQMERREGIRERFARLSQPSRAVVQKLLANECNSQAPTITLREIAAHMGLIGPSLDAVQSELSRVFGVKVVLHHGNRKKVVTQ